MLTGRAVYRSHILSALVHVLLAALSLRVFTLVLLRQGVPRPAALAFWLVATGLTVLWAVWMARRAPATRGGLFPILRKVNAPPVVLLAFLLLLIWMFHQGYERAASDGRSYFVQVRSLVIDQDFALEEEIASFHARDAARIYPVGTAILCATHATGTAERDAAVLLLEASASPGSTVGADKGYDVARFVADVRVQDVTPHVAQKVRGSAIDGRTTRHAGYHVSQRKRKLVEQVFGWMKTVGGLRKLRHRGIALVDWQLTFAATAYNLVRLRNLEARCP